MSKINQETLQGYVSEILSFVSAENGGIEGKEVLRTIAVARGFVRKARAGKGRAPFFPTEQGLAFIKVDNAMIAKCLEVARNWKPGNVVDVGTALIAYDKKVTQLAKLIATLTADGCVLPYKLVKNAEWSQDDGEVHAMMLQDAYTKLRLTGETISAD